MLWVIFHLRKTEALLGSMDLLLFVHCVEDWVNDVVLYFVEVESFMRVVAVLLILFLFQLQQRFLRRNKWRVVARLMARTIVVSIFLLILVHNLNLTINDIKAVISGGRLKTRGSLSSLR